MSVTSSNLTELLTGFRALADPLRLKILETLGDRELCVCDLCEKLAVNQSKLSFHLKTLKQAQLIQSRQEGRWMYYSLNLPQFVLLEGYLAEYQRFSSILPAPQCQ
jgi:ArsR family transcriptional regulator